MGQAQIHKENTDNKDCVVDGFRNIAEIIEFRRVYNNDFYLFGINVDDRQVRFSRIEKKLKEKPIDQLLLEDERDRGERFKYGQQVSKCMYLADIIIDNSEEQYLQTGIETHLKRKIDRYISLINGEKKERMNWIEEYMQQACIASEDSNCVNRQVGAAIFGWDGKIISTGYNKPPIAESCVEIFQGCHKEQINKELWEEVWKWIEGKVCPKCDWIMTIGQLETNSYYCVKCGFDIKNFLMPTKGSDHCISIHAEEKAILGIDEKILKDSIMFTTTFPCLQCALKITHVGINSIYYIDPYPLPETQWIKTTLFKDLIIRKYSGVKSKFAYKTLFK